MKNKKLLLIPLFLTLCAGYLSFEDSVLKVTHYNVTSEKIPSSFAGFKIVQISDFHNVEIEFLRNQIVKSLKKENPNIIVITGDFIDANTPNINILVDFLDKIYDVAPIYFVTGNHEVSRSSNYPLLREQLLKYEVNVMENDIDVLIKNGESINIVGVNDPGIFHAKEIRNEDLFRIEINDIEYDKNNFTILLCHRPELFQTYVEEQFDLVFTGHAHGGQVRVPFVGGLYAPGQGYFPKYTAGAFKEENTQMIVSRGIGNSLFPFRVNNRPELVITTLCL